MHSGESNIPHQISRVLNIIPKPMMDAVMALHKNLDDKQIEWALTGDLAEALRVVKVEPDCVEVVTSKENAENAFQALQEFSPSQIELKIQKLSRSANIEKEQRPVFIRSYYFEFLIGSVLIKVHGDFQYRIDNWDWGDVLQFTPEYVYLTTQKTALVPLSIKHEIYQMLGWKDRSDKIEQVTNRKTPHKSGGA
jgi:hypothetical protein